MKTIYELCKPRPDIFNEFQQDDALDLANLTDNSINVDTFFEETYITEGMHTLIDVTFQRFAGKGTRGLIRLKQSMGGGKTHNMITVSLLAQYPELRKYAPSNILHGVDKPIKVISFTGRNSDARYGIWGEIAKQMGKQELFKDYYMPLSAPGQNSWIELLKGEPVLIVLDELPPYLSYLRTRPIGAGTLADVTVTALSNLFNAVNKGGDLSNVCIIVSDLKSTYESGSDLLEKSFKDLDGEISRTAMDIEPVKATSDDLYNILKKKLFESLPEDDEIIEVATEYKNAVSKAKQMGYTGVDDNSVYSGIVEVYPFHPCIKDLFARFKENNGFQQTRGFIRLTRLMVRSLFENDGAKAKKKTLINAYDYNLNDTTTYSQITNIKPKMSNAISHDIVSEGRGQAEIIDNNTGSDDMQEIAKMILMASLGDVTGVILGLNANDIIGNMVAPGRDMSNFKQLVEQFNTKAWYLYKDKNDRLFFRDIQNVNAKLNTIVTSYNSEQAKQEIKKILQGRFAPKLKDCYQKVYVFPAIDEIQLTKEQVSLVLFEPNPIGGLPKELQNFFEQTSYKNRLMFLSGQHDTMNALLEVSKEYRAITSIIKELKSEGIAENDTQYQSALNLEHSILLRMNSSLNETFVTLYYPGRGNKIRSKEITMDFVANDFNPESQIRNLLVDVGKFTEHDKLMEDTFRKKIEARIFTARTMRWQDLQERAATQMEWNWYNPNALKEAKERYVLNNLWAEDGDMLDKEPPAPKTEISVREISRREDGGVILKLNPTNGDTVYWEVGQPATEASSRVKDISNFETDEMVLYFLCVDSTGEHESGDSVRWTNEIKVRYRFYDSGNTKYCELKADNPNVIILYTTDGSNPRTGAIYQEPFAIPPNGKLLQALSYYEKGDIYGPILAQQLPKPNNGNGNGASTIKIDDEKKLYLNHEFDLNNNKSVYEFVVEMKNRRLDAEVGRILVEEENDNEFFVDLSLGKITMNGAMLENQLETIRSSIMSVEKVKNIVEITKVIFPSGRDFKKWIEDRKEEINKYQNSIKQ